MTETRTKICPTCGSRRIRRVRRDISIDKGQLHFNVPDVEFDACPNCGEQIFDLAAMEKINAHRPRTNHGKAGKRKIA